MLGSKREKVRGPKGKLCGGSKGKRIRAQKESVWDINIWTWPTQSDGALYTMAHVSSGC